MGMVESNTFPVCDGRHVGLEAVDCHRLLLTSMLHQEGRSLTFDTVGMCLTKWAALVSLCRDPLLFYCLCDDAVVCRDEMQNVTCMCRGVALTACLGVVPLLLALGATVCNIQMYKPSIQQDHIPAAKHHQMEETLHQDPQQPVLKVQTLLADTNNEEYS